MTLDKKPVAGGSGAIPVVRLFRGAWIAAVLFTLGLLACGCSPSTPRQPVAEKGVMDLAAWDFTGKGVVELKGEWEFYWQRLRGPEEFSAKPQPGAADYIPMPVFWNGQTIAGTRLPGHGYATMRLIVRLEGGKNLYSMYIPQMHTAYRLWVNGRQVSSNGNVGTDAVREVPEFLPRIVVLTADNNLLDLVLQVSNFHHPRGGMWSSIKLGRDSQILNRQRYLAGFHSFLLGGLILMALYHLGIFLFRRKDLASLFFSVLCLVMALRVPFENDRMLLGLIPWLSWEPAQKISYLTLFTSMMIMNLYLYHLFPDIYSRVVVRASNAIGAAFCLSILVLTAQIYFYTRYPFYAIMLFFSIYDLYVVVRSVMMKKEGASYLIGGMIILLATAVLDILYHDRIIDFGNVSGFGVLIFTISQALLLSDRSSKAFTRIEVLSSEKAQLFANSIDIISSILLASSTRLYEYTQNVARISVMLARRIGLPQDYIEEIRIAALLHDIGMMGLPDDLTGGARRRSDAERQIMENHPRKSIEIIENLKGLAGVKLIIAQHHERHDGSGYPSRLGGTDIVIGARIIGLVDDFVSMLGRREFQAEDKKSMIIEELRQLKGSLYDPGLVEMLVQLIEKKNLVYIINEKDIRHEKREDASEWVFPSNVNYELTVVQRVMAEVRANTSLSEDMLFLIEAGLGETVRNAIIHGNKYDESKRVTVLFTIGERDGRRLLRFRIADEGIGMDLTRFNHFKESRLDLYTIVREMKQRIALLESAECREVFGSINMKLQSFLIDYYINYNRYRQLDSSETSGGIGLIQVMQTFDNVDFRPIVASHTYIGMEAVLEKYID